MLGPRMRAVAVVGSLSVVLLLVGCGDSDSPIEEDARYYGDGVARACADTGHDDLAGCQEIVESMIAPNSLPTDADSAELHSIGYSQACTNLFPGCDPAKVEEEKRQAEAAYGE